MKKPRLKVIFKYFANWDYSLTERLLFFYLSRCPICFNYFHSSPAPQLNSPLRVFRKCSNWLYLFIFSFRLRCLEEEASENKSGGTVCINHHFVEGFLCKFRLDTFISYILLNDNFSNRILFNMISCTSKQFEAGRWHRNHFSLCPPSILPPFFFLKEN